MQVPLKPLFSVETKCFVGLLNAALWALNFKHELGSKVSQWIEKMEEPNGDPLSDLALQLIPGCVWWDIYTYWPCKNGARMNFYSLQQNFRMLCLSAAAHEILSVVSVVPGKLRCLGLSLGSVLFPWVALQDAWSCHIPMSICVGVFSCWDFFSLNLPSFLFLEIVGIRAQL